MKTTRRIWPALLNRLTIPYFAGCCLCLRYSGNNSLRRKKLRARTRPPPRTADRARWDAARGKLGRNPPKWHGETALNLDDPFSDKGGISWKHCPNEPSTFFYNCRTISLACERRHGAGQQLVGGGLRMCHCCLSLCHGNPLVHSSSRRESSRRCWAS